VSFDRKTITSGPIAGAGSKTSVSHRVVPLWPQLEEICGRTCSARNRPPSKLLFPSWRRARAMLTDFPKLLDAVPSGRAGRKATSARSSSVTPTSRRGSRPSIVARRLARGRWLARLAILDRHDRRDLRAPRTGAPLGGSGVPRGAARAYFGGPLDCRLPQRAQTCAKRKRF